MPDPRRAICTVAVGPHAELLDLARPGLEAYALRHGYDLVTQTDVVGDRPPAWQKVPLLLSLLRTYETVVWIDADAVVVDPYEDLASSVGARPIHLVVHHVGGVAVPNTGVMVVRRSASAIDLLGRMWAQHDQIHHRWWENAALIAVMGGDPDRGLTSRRSVWRSRRWLGALHPRWNSIPTCPTPRPAIVHLAGMPHAERVRAMVQLTGRDLAARAPASRA